MIYTQYLLITYFLRNMGKFVNKREQAHADEINQTDRAYPIRWETVPDQHPQWNYNSAGGILGRDRFVTCLLAGLRKAALKPVILKNFKRLSKINRKIISIFRMPERGFIAVYQSGP